MDNSNYNNDIRKTMGNKPEYEKIVLEDYFNEGKITYIPSNTRGFTLGVSGRGRAIRGTDWSKNFSERDDKERNE